MADDIPLYEGGGMPLSQIPADDVKVTDYRVMPWPDGTRVTVEMGLTVFRQFPAMDVSVIDETGETLRMASVVGTLERRPSPTLFIPRLPAGTRLRAVVEMVNNDVIYQRIEVPFEVAGPIVKAVVAP